MMTDAFDGFMDWSRDAKEFTGALAENPSTLKILMKCKDETEFLKSWIDWHTSICGQENIFILDNMSTSPEIAAIYRAYPKVKVCRYSSFLDNVHNRSIFSEIYEALAIGACYYTFLDADEFLTLVEDADHHNRTNVVPFIERNMDAALFPGVWLNNKPGSKTTFDLGGNCGNIRGGLLYGKPITKAGTTLFGDIILHNVGAYRVTTKDVVRNNLAVLHTPKLIPARRIRSGVNKLIHHRALSAGATIADALAIPEDNSLNRHARNILTEIRWLVANPDAWDDRPGELAIGMAEFADDGCILHSTAEQRRIYQAILDDASLFCRTVESELRPKP